MTDKICTVCKVAKSLAEFSTSTVKKSGYRPECRSCAAIKTAEWRINNPEKYAKQLKYHSEYRKKKYAQDSGWRKKLRVRQHAYYHGLPAERKRKMGWANHLKGKYGLTVAQYESMMIEQDGKCALCGASGKDLEVDHDHHTGEIRGMLCSKCNMGIGLLGDTEEGVASALRYLKKSRVDAADPDSLVMVLSTLMCG